MQKDAVEPNIQTVLSINRCLFDRARFYAHQNNIDVSTIVEQALENLLKEKMVTYIMGDDTGMVKIGKTKNIDRRYRELSAGNPTLKLLFEHEGDIENRLHKKYKVHNVVTDGTATEWFKLTKKQIEDLVFEEHFSMIDENDFEMFLTKVAE